MSRQMLDLLGQPVTFHDVSPQEAAERLYALGDACEPGSLERAAYYRRAAAAQQRAEASADLARRCAERREAVSAGEKGRSHRFGKASRSR